VVSTFTGQVWGAVGATAGTVAMEALGRAAGCYNNPDDAPGFGKDEPPYEGCQEFSSGYGIFSFKQKDGQLTVPIAEFVRMIDCGKFDPLPPGELPPTHYVTFINREGQEETNTRRDFSIVDEAPFGVATPWADAVCSVPGPDGQYPDWQPDTPIGPTYTYYDSETDCTWQIKPYDVYLNSAGEPIFHWKATSDDPIKCGGPYEWWGNGQDPNIPNFPNPKQDDEPDPPPPIPPGPGTDIKEKLDDILERLEELEKCACPEKPELAKHWRSIRFQSDEPSPNSRTRLHKLFRYRGNSPGVITTLADHWQGFRWITGPVCVYHKGSPLGTPQVWAATPNEGQRVIRHAGREAGIDPDQVGEWRVGGSDNPRYGVSLEVGLFRVDGCWSATSRPGPDGWPEASVVFPDP